MSERWRQTTEEDLWSIADHLAAIPHITLLPVKSARPRRWMDPRLRAAGLHGYPG